MKFWQRTLEFARKLLVRSQINYSITPHIMDGLKLSDSKYGEIIEI